jgi:hypothetical protein
VSTDNEDATLPEPLEHPGSNGTLCRLIEVRKRGVAAENEIERAVRHDLSHVFLPKRYSLPDLVADPEDAVVLERCLTERRRELTQASRRVTASLGSGDHRLVDVGREEVHPHARVVRRDLEIPYDRDRVGLLAGRAPRAPNPNTPPACAGGRLGVLGKDLASYPLEDRAIAMKARDRDATKPTERSPLVLRRLETRSVPDEIANAELCHPADDALANRTSHVAKAFPP